MADSNVPTYPNMFDPSQLINKYSDLNSAKFPMYNYYGTPTDAMGKPITSYQPPAAPVAAAPSQGTTINSLPAVGSPARAMVNAGYGDWSQLDPTLGTSSRSALASSGFITQDANGNYGRSSFATLPGQPGQATAQTQTQQAPQGNFNYLTALANPDKVVTPGIQNYPARSNQPGGFDVDALIAKLQGSGMTAPSQAQTGLVGGTGPSNNFLSTLAALRAGSPAKG